MAKAPKVETEEFRNEKPPEEGFRDDQGRFTGNPATVEERLDAICDLLEANGWSLPKVLQRDK